MLKRLRTPKFWYERNSVWGRVLRPVSKIYELLFNTKYGSIVPSKINVPVVSVNSVMLSGAGKTPTVKFIFDVLKKNAFNPHILTRGYGGYIKNVIRVDPNLHSYLQVGDEALVSAQFAPTWIGRHHFKSAQAAVFGGAEALVVDNGFYCKTLVKDFNILVIDENQRFGNEQLLPAGPLVETVSNGIKTSDAILIIGEKSDELETKIRLVKDVPIFYAKLTVSTPVVIKNNKVLGFCGLGYPKKFKQTLEHCKYDIVDFVTFSDHHPYTITEIQRLIEKASSVNATLITTLKDYVKIPDVFRSEMKVVPISVVPENDLLEQLLIERVKNS